MKNGLGFRNLSILNKAFLDTWLWSLMVVRDTLYKGAILDKFGKRGCCSHFPIGI